VCAMEYDQLVEGKPMDTSAEAGRLELFVAAAMTGILANPRPRKHGILTGKDVTPAAVAECALACAKAMLFALDADRPGTPRRVERKRESLSSEGKIPDQGRRAKRRRISPSRPSPASDAFPATSQPEDQETGGS
jgi:hypothetical protein